MALNLSDIGFHPQGHSIIYKLRCFEDLKGSYTETASPCRRLLADFAFKAYSGSGLVRGKNLGRKTGRSEAKSFYGGGNQKVCPRKGNLRVFSRGPELDALYDQFGVVCSPALVIFGEHEVIAKPLFPSRSQLRLEVFLQPHERHLNTIITNIQSL
jgi:hypothetical protein